MGPFAPPQPIGVAFDPPIGRVEHDVVDGHLSAVALRRGVRFATEWLSPAGKHLLGVERAVVALATLEVEMGAGSIGLHGVPDGLLARGAEVLPGLDAAALADVGVD